VVVIVLWLKVTLRLIEVELRVEEGFAVEDELSARVLWGYSGGGSEDDI
jgi:hypothetical protein